MMEQNTNASHSQPQRQPNIVLILSDDQGWGDLSRSGNTQISTPRLDRLADDGATMQNFHVQPLCAPTRAEILTGRYYPWTGVKGVSKCAERLSLDETTIADYFKRAGYATGCFGKWHSGMQYPYHPNGRGFDLFYGYCCGHWSHYFDSTIEENGVEVQAPGYLTDALTTRAIDFIRENKDNPFLCYVPLNTPHSPFQVPDRWFDKFADADLPLRATHPDKEDLMATRSVLAMCENIDWNVGRILDELDQLDLTRDTIVVYLSDNGPNTWRYNGGMDGKKGGCQEGGVRSPCSITWPGHIIPGSHIQHVAGGIDLMPTLADLAGVAIEETKPIDGVSLRPLLTQQDASTQWPARNIFAQEVHGYTGVFGAMSLRSDQYRAYEDGRVYELASDIGETNDLAAQLPEISAAMKQAMTQWRDRLPNSAIDQALPVGCPAFPMTYLPAQDAQPQGSITWSSVHPNCSWLKNWQDKADEVTWHIQVHTPGRYAVTVMYACSAEDVGSELELSFADQTTRGRVTTAFDSLPKTGFDRVQRDESYDKAFAPLDLGTITLPAKQGLLTLRCIDQIGKTVCEVRTVKLTLLQDASCN
jgi:arylsulfatase A-like enzyme